MFVFQNMKVHATLNNLRVAPRKVRLLTHGIVGMDTREALVQLSKQTKRSGKSLYELLKSAVANASNNFGLDKSNLYIFEIRVGDGLRLKRWSPRAFGRAAPLLRRGSNITFILEEKIEGKNRLVKKKAVRAETVEDSEIIEEKEEKQSFKMIKPEARKDNIKDITKKTGSGKVVKKIFQRKSA